MKDLHFDGTEPTWAKDEIIAGNPWKLGNDVEALLKEIEKLRQANRDISAEFEKTRQVL